MTNPLAGELAKQAYALGDGGGEVQAGLEEWRDQAKVSRLWQGDASLWTGADEDRWLGWLHAVDGRRDHLEALQRLVGDVRQAGIKHVLLLGMGGSSLCPELISETFGPASGFPRLLVLDSTVPAQVKDFERQIDLKDTLFIVSSKSGGTTETQVLKQYFFARAEKLFGKDRAGSRFIAITDAGTKLHEQARSGRFRHILHGEPNIGGRYSALSNFGMAPAAIMGVDVPDFLDRAEIMVRSCASFVPPHANPAVVLGMILGVLGINPFDQPDVEASKVATRKLTVAYEQTGKLADESPLLREDGVSVLADPQNAAAVGPARAKGLEAVLAAHLSRIRLGDYFAVNAYVAMSPANRKELQAIRHAVRDAKRVATTLGFGPRFLHSTGQLHKGGPHSGVFLQITSDDAEDLPIPGQGYTFGMLKRFQAQGDFEVLAERGRRLLRVHLGPDVPAALRRLGALVRSALR